MEQSVGCKAVKTSTHQLNKKNVGTTAQNTDSLSPQSVAHLHCIKII